ncbi:MAG: 2-C-methyl-D-erythritol 4-phosphate cytidylyltransferase [Gammaproteobacteria bacterium]|nr:2-C-methyl-D-erythritol 4-phosphate cytidylyltransferase [Gammaproteobacteria bacterium]
MSETTRYWAVIPAAGIGTRMGAVQPKQYLTLRGKTILEHSITRLVAHPRISGVMVALSPQDELWPTLMLTHISKLIYTTVGGAERADSVLNAITALSKVAAENDWVLVHDAARPCLRSSDIDRLIQQLAQHPIGGLLGLPVADTMKRTNAQGEIIATVPREHLWRALTPQMFRLAVLRDALRQAASRGLHITDEAAAMEAAGYMPMMVEGHPDNIKITRPEDLALAQMYLEQQERNA